MRKSTPSGGAATLRAGCLAMTSDCDNTKWRRASNLRMTNLLNTLLNIVQNLSTRKNLKKQT